MFTAFAGVILRFILVRDGIELYRGLDLAYTDDTTILPYKSYTYVLTACTVAGCISSPSVSSFVVWNTLYTVMNQDKFTSYTNKLKD